MSTSDSDIPSPPESVEAINIEDEMRQSYLDYAMSVIIGRALPDVRDGLKPVHRRILYAMQDLGNVYNRAYKKSARVVGDVIGKYHPHGDSAVYDTMVRMAQDFSMRHELVDGQGNFGSVDGDRAAAMRYTEVRMTKLTSEMLADIDKETVDFGPNYDDSLVEPLVLPARVPNLIVNGSSGIAVGMATNIPPHNLGEIIEATIALAKDSALPLEALLKIVPGPDFPTGGIVYGAKALPQAYKTGKGIIKVRGRAEIQDWKKDRERIIITELPFQVNKAKLVEKAAELVNEKRIEDISDIRDESNRDGMRVVIELKRDANSEVILNQLYSLTQLQTSFGFNMLAIVNGQPQLLGLKAILQYFIDHRREVVTRRTHFELREARKRFNVVYGLLAAIDAIDRVIEIIRASKDQAQAKADLMAEHFPMSQALKTLTTELVTFEYETAKAALANSYMQMNERQAQAILDMRLARLTGLERDKLAKEAGDLRDTIVRLLEILGSDTRLLEVVVGELQAIRDEYADERRTELVADIQHMSIEDLVADEEVIVTVSHLGYIKRVNVDTYRAQRRGGKGISAAKTRDQDFVENIFVASTHSYVLAFSSAGKVYWLKVHEIPQASRQARGKPLVNLIKVGKGEKITAVLPVREFNEGQFLVFATRNGYIKKTDLMAFAKPRPSGLIALTIDDSDQLINVRLTEGDSEVLIATKQGMAIRFSEADVRPMGRSARGVKAINLKKAGDGVVGMVILDDKVSSILTVTTKGYGKRTEVGEYRTQSRGGSGIINCKLTDRNGAVAAVCAAEEEDQLMVVTDKGMMIRTRVEQISTLGRSTQGVRVLNVAGGENVSSVARMMEADES